MNCVLMEVENCVVAVFAVVADMFALKVDFTLASQV